MLTQVLIVGAGPTGLTLACALRRLGVACRIIDKAAGPATTSRAIGTHSRTLEIFAMMGVIDEILARGHRGTGVSMYAKGELLLDLPIDGLDGVPYPFMLMMAQADTEAVLRAHLASLGGAVEWGIALHSFEDGASSVTAALHGPSGEERVEARYLVSCEGAHSSVRHALGLSFEGEKHAAEFLLFDADVRWSVPRERTHVWFGQEGTFAAMPLPGTSLWRLFADVAPGADGVIPPATLSLFQRLLLERTGLTDAAIGEPLWASNFRIHKRMVDRYRVGHVLLAGDAAHVHSPFGGQGMNTGIGDAWNLGWKLAWVLRGDADARLLDTYEEERLPIARGVLASTGRNTRLFYAETALLRAFRRWVLLPLLGRKAMRRRLIWSTSQLRVNYRGTSLCQGKLGDLRGGDRMPDGVIDPRGTSLHTKLDGLRFTVVTIGLTADERADLTPRRGVAAVDLSPAITRTACFAAPPCPGEASSWCAPTATSPSRRVIPPRPAPFWATLSEEMPSRIG